jgi:hypothetical protein
MDLQFEIPRSVRPKLICLVAVILAVALWPALRHVMSVVSPSLNSDVQEESAGWDLRAM